MLWAVGKEGDNSGPTSRHLTLEIMFCHSCNTWDTKEGKWNNDLDALGCSFELHGILVVEFSIILKFLSSGIYCPSGPMFKELGHWVPENQQPYPDLISLKFLSKNCPPSRGQRDFPSSLCDRICASIKFSLFCRPDSVLRLPDFSYVKVRLWNSAKHFVSKQSLGFHTMDSRKCFLKFTAEQWLLYSRRYLTFLRNEEAIESEARGNMIYGDGSVIVVNISK